MCQAHMSNPKYSNPKYSNPKYWRAGAQALPAPTEAVPGGSDIRRSQVICLTAAAP